MSPDDVIKIFKKLANRLSDQSTDEREELTATAFNSNTWFTAEAINASLDGIVKILKDDLSTWVAGYNFNGVPKKIGVVMAGNIPAVGFHDMLCVLVSGHTLVAKLSEKDGVIMRYLISELLEIEPQLNERIQLTDRLNDVDAVIATGSDNTARYFEYYFKKYPNIIRKNRTSIAVLNGSETAEDFDNLAEDIFLYFGLGCRNVSKLFVPADYNFTELLASYENKTALLNHHKYRNNYDYNKSIYLVNGEEHLDNGSLLLKRDSDLVSPISVLFYENYESEEHLEDIIQENQLKIQCIVSKEGYWPSSVPFGEAQYPGLRDYADGIDTMKFLSQL